MPSGSFAAAHPVVLTPECRTRQDVVLPLAQPVRGVDGTMMHEIFVPKDTSVDVGLLASNRNKAIWGEDAEKWKPERWLSPLPDSVGEAHVPGIYSNLYVELPTTDPHVYV